MIVVTHEIGFARQVADEVVFMADGRVAEQGPPSQVIDNPREEATQIFLRSMAARAEAPVSYQLAVGSARCQFLRRRGSAG